MDEVVEKLVDVILRWSSVELRRGCGGFSEERWVLPPWLVEKRARGREELLCEKEDYREGRGRWLRWASDGAWTGVSIRGSTSRQRRHAHRCSRGLSAREKRTVRRRKSRNKRSVHKLLSLLHSSKLIFQAFKNHANFCVDTRNQDQPILLGIGRKAIVDLK